VTENIVKRSATSQSHLSPALNASVTLGQMDQIKLALALSCEETTMINNTSPGYLPTTQQTLPSL
jgi:hypothetical protein